MTNEEKAKKLSSKCNFTIKESNAAYNAALEIAEWKDEQWKKMLQDAFIGAWTASLDIAHDELIRTTTISFVKHDY